MSPVRSTNVSLLVLLLGVSIGACQSASRITRSDSADPAADTYKLFLDYVHTPTADKRRQIREATGTHEILASRVFKSFEVWTAPGFENDDRTQFDRANFELHENLPLSLWVLKPIAYETPVLGMETEWEQEVGLYISLCASLAGVEHDDFAHSILAELAKHPNPTVAKYARELLQFVTTEENYVVKSRRYQATQDWQALNWLQQEYLQRGMSRAEIEQTIGKGVDIRPSTSVYVGKLGDGRVKRLFVSYYDGMFDSSKWESNSPATTAESAAR
jgi:hypothetical protein